MKITLCVVLATALVSPPVVFPYPYALAPESIFARGRNAKTAQSPDSADPLRFVKHLIAKAVDNFTPKRVTEMGMHKFKEISKKGAFKYLDTRNISKEDFPVGYPTAMREPDPAKVLPGEVKVTLSDVDIFLVSSTHIGSKGAVRLGWLKNGTPVAVKGRYTRNIDNDNAQARKDYEEAFILDRLGIGPRVHGYFADEHGRFSFAMDVVPGDFMLDSPDFITPQTIKDLIEIQTRLAAGGKSMEFDFQYLMTREGRIIVFDSEGLSAATAGVAMGYKTFDEHLADLLLAASGRVLKQALDDMGRNHPPLARNLILAYPRLQDRYPDFPIPAPEAVSVATVEESPNTDMFGPGKDRRDVLGGPTGVREAVAKALARISGCPEGECRTTLDSLPAGKIKRIFEFLETLDEGVKSRLVAPLVVEDAIDFLVNYARCRGAEVYGEEVYKDAAQEIVAKLVTIPGGNAMAASAFLAETYFGGDDEAPVHRAHILQAIYRLDPVLGQKIFRGSFEGGNLPEYLLVYQLMPDRTMIKEWCLKDPSVLPSELWRMLFARDAQAPSSWDAAVYKAYVEYVKQWGKIPGLNVLTKKVEWAAKRQQLVLEKSYPVKEVKQSVERLNRWYRLDVLLANRAIGFWPQRLREVREKMGIKQQELSKMAGLGTSAVTVYENGHVTPRTKDLLRMAKVLGVDPLYFMGNEKIKVRYPVFNRERFAWAIEQNNVTNAQVARAGGVSEETIKNWRAGRTIKKIHMNPRLQRIAQFLKVPYAYLMGLDDTVPKIPRFMPERLTLARQRLQLTLKQAAELTGIHRLTLGGWESGKVIPREKDIRAIAEKLNVTVEYLMGLENLDLKIPAFKSIRLKIARLRAGLTQRDMDQIMRKRGDGAFDPGWEFGECAPSPEKIKVLLEILNFSEAWMMGVEGEDGVMPKFVPSRLMAARIHRGLSREELARRLNRRSWTIYRLETGYETRLSEIKRLANALGVTYGYLMGFEEDPSIVPLPLDRARFKKALEFRHMPLLKLSVKTQIPLTQLSAFLSGQDKPDEKEIGKIEAGLQVPNGYLVGIGKDNALKPGLSKQRLKLALVLLAMDSGELAAQLDIPLAQLRSYLAQDAYPTLDLVDRMAKILQVTRGFLTAQDAAFPMDRMVIAARFMGAAIPPRLLNFDRSNPPITVAEELGEFARRHRVPYAYLTGREDIVLHAGAINKDAVWENRKRMKLSRTELTLRMGLGPVPKLIFRIEHGERSASLKEIDRLAYGLGVEPRSLLREPQLPLRLYVTVSSKYRGKGAAQVRLEEARSQDQIGSSL